MQFLKTYNDFCRRELGLLERISGESVTSLVNQRIKHHVEHTCRGNFESPFLESLEQVNLTKIFRTGKYNLSENVTVP